MNPRGVRSGLGARSRSLELGWLLFLSSAAACLRLWSLDERPFHHDEAIHAWFADRLAQGGPYRFDPVYHGPFLYWTTGLLFRWAGANDFTARLLPALASVGMVALLWGLRRDLGRTGWKLAAALMILSPTFAYYGRFLAHDDYCALFTLALVALALAYARAPRPGRLAAMGAIAGLFLATKAVAYLHLGLFTLFLLGVLLHGAYRHRPAPRFLLRFVPETLGVRVSHLVWGAAALAATYTAFYTNFFTDWAGPWRGVHDMLAYWAGQQGEPRIPGPWYYYLPRMLFHEPVAWFAVAALGWALACRPTRLDAFLVFWTLSALAVYGYAQEKVPWLLMHVLTPQFLLVGRWATAVERGAGARPWLAAAVLVALAWSARETRWLVFLKPPGEPHLLTYMEPARAIQETARRILATQPGSKTVVVIGPPTWPLGWYLRGLPVEYTLADGWARWARLVVSGDEDRERMQAAGFRQHTHRLMTWWNPALHRLFGPGFLPYLLHHRSGPDFGEIRFHVFERTAESGAKPNP